MRYIRLEAFEDSPTGYIGLGVHGFTHNPELFADQTGGLIAHDIIDHQNGFDKIGKVEDELEAIGAIWYNRGQHGYPEIKDLCRPPEDVLKGEIVQCAIDLRYKEDQTWIPKIGSYRTRPHDNDEEFLYIIKSAAPQISEELHGSSYFTHLDAFVENTLHLLRMGARKSARRWPGGPFNPLDQYVAIEKALEPYARSPEFPGQQFILGYGKGRATCREVPYDDLFL